MDLSQRTVLIVGGTSGIGRELARRFAAAGSTVAVGGRSARARTDLSGEGIDAFDVDVTDEESVARARDAVLDRHPGLDTVVTMAGVMLMEDLRDPGHFAAARTTVDTNLLGTIRVVDAFTPHLIRRGSGTFVTVTSGIAFLPFPPMPTYAASKAAVHAYSEALRAQLEGTGVGVVELVPPAVATGAREVNPHALPLDDFAEEAMGLLAQEPPPTRSWSNGSTCTAGPSATAPTPTSSRSAPRPWPCSPAARADTRRAGRAPAAPASAAPPPGPPSPQNRWPAPGHAPYTPVPTAAPT